MKSNTFCVSLHCSILPLSPLRLFSKIPISYSLASGGCDFGELRTTQKGLFVSRKDFISGQVGKHDSTHVLERDRERQLSPLRGYSAFVLLDCPFPKSPQGPILSLTCLDNMSVWAWHTASLWERRHTPKFFLPGNNSAFFLSFWDACSIFRAHENLTFDPIKNAYLVIVLQRRLKSHSDYRSLLSSHTIRFSTGPTNHTPLPVQFSHSSGGAKSQTVPHANWMEKGSIVSVNGPRLSSLVENKW